MPARRLASGFSNLRADPSKAEIARPISTVGWMASGGSPNRASSSSAAATCPPFPDLIPCGVPLRASRPSSRGPAAERADQPADRTEEDGAQHEVRHRSAEVPEGGRLQGRLDLRDLCRRREVPDPLGGGPALLAFLPDLRAYLVHVGDDLGRGLGGVVAGGPREHRRLQRRRQEERDPDHDRDHRRRKGAVAHEQRPVRHPGVEPRRTHPEGREHGQKQEQRQGQPRPVLGDDSENPTRHTGRIDHEEIEVRGERDEHADYAVTKTRP